MLGHPPLVSPFRGLVHRVQDWPAASQQQARRNAMIAATACAQRRAEREEVADYLDGLATPAASPATAAPGRTARA